MLKFQKENRRSNSQGFILVVTIIVMAILLFMASYFLDFSLTETKIAKSEAISNRTYYLAEAGINEAIWKLKNDPSWKNNFENNSSWSATFSRENIFYPQSSYQVQIQNSDYAKGEIISTAKISLGKGKTSQRVVKVKVFKALNPNPIGKVALFSADSDSDLDIMASVINVEGANFLTNGNLILKLFSTLTTDRAVQAVGNILIESGSTLNGEKEAKNYPPAPLELQMPMIDFDSENANSYKNQADVIYTEEEFADLLWNNQNLTLNKKIVYVTGGVDLRGGQSLTINGVLVTDGTINIGENFCWWRDWHSRCGLSKIKVNHSENEPSGIITKGKINIGLFASQINIDGLVYANNEIKLVSLPQVFKIKGGLLTRKLSTISIWQGLNIIYDPKIIMQGLKNPLYSPVVTIEHWEEEY